MTRLLAGTSLLLFFLITTLSLHAQDGIVDSYLNRTGKYAEIYNGRIETVYSSVFYSDLPYYVSSDYASGKLVYNGINYPGIEARLDLYKEQLILKSPGDNYSVVVVNDYVDSLYIYNDVFLYLDKEKKGSLKEGYYCLLYDGNMQLLHKQSALIDTRDVVHRFNIKNHHYLLLDGVYHNVSNKKSFIKIFPQYKKEINRFSKEQKLNFKNDKKNSLALLARYCDELVYGDEPREKPAAGRAIPKPIGTQETRQLFADINSTELDTIFSFAADGESLHYNRSSYAYETNGKPATSENKIYMIGDPLVDPASPTLTLKGKVIDSKLKEPLIGVNIVSKETGEGATSDGLGNYTLTLSPGRHQLDITGFNIKNARRQVMVYNNGTLDIEIIEETFELDEVTVFAGRVNQVKNTEIGLERLQVSKIKNIPMVLGEADVLRAIQTLPGVKTVGEASTGFNVRGGATDQNLILLNNNTLYNPNHLFGFFSAFSTDMVSEAEIYKSSIPARYGGRISSVLEVKGKEASMEEFSGKAGIGLVTSNAALEIPIVKQKSSLLLTGRTTYSDWILKQIPEDSGYNDGKAGFYDLGLVFTQKINDKNQLNIYGYYSYDRFSFSADEKYMYRNLNASFTWRSMIGSKLSAYFSGGYDHYEYDNHQYYPEYSAYKLGFDINQFFGKADFSYFLKEHKIDFGIKSTLYNLDAGIYEPENKNSIIRPDKLQTEKALESAIYISDNWEITDKWSIDAGIRYSMYNALGPREYYTYDPRMLPYESTRRDTVSAGSGEIFKTYHGPEFRLAARYLINNQLSVKAGMNTMRQYIHKISNTLIMSPTDTWKLSDVNIKPQRGWQTATGLFYNAPSLEWEASLEVYYKKMHDYLDYRPGAQLIMNHHIETDVINTEGYAYGAELSFRKSIGRLTGWASYTYSRTFLRQSDDLIANPVNNGDWYPTDYDKPHDFKLVGNFRLTHRYSVSLNVDYSTGRPTTIPTSQYYDHELGAYQTVYTDRNTHRIPDYFRADFSFNIEPHHKLTLLTHSTLNIGVYNVTGRKNVYNVYFISEEGQIQGKQLSIFGSPIPFITYNIKF